MKTITANTILTIHIKAIVALIIFCQLSMSLASDQQLNSPTDNTQKFSISGISSGGFMAVQMATIFSNNFLGVGSVAGGFFYCAKNGLQEQILAGQRSLLGVNNLLLFEPTGQINSQSLQPEFRPSVNNPIFMSVGLCMGNPQLTTLPSLSQFVFDQSIEPLDHFKKLQVYIYNGKNDSIVKNSMIQKLVDFYNKNGIEKKQIKVVQSKGGHNFPTSKSGLNSCLDQKVPYVSSCRYDAASDILSHLLKTRVLYSQPDLNHLYIVDQNIEHQNSLETDIKKLKQPIPSIGGYGYLYASDQCLNTPENCHLHVALHGCEMSDSYDQAFDDLFQKQILNYKIMGMRSEQDSQQSILQMMQSLPTIEQKNNQYGLLKFALNSGYIDYAEKNNIMILFPQTWITEANYPYNPKGCWDWYGWTGANYATVNGAEPQWLMEYIKNIKTAPKTYILNIPKPVQP